MIDYITGTVVAVGEDYVVLDLGGVGIQVQAPVARLDPAPRIGETLRLDTQLRISEDAWTLYGFAGDEQRDIFRLLLNISGIGAKTALSVINGIAPARIAQAVADGDVKVFTAVSGIGKKSAERIILELKDKLELLPAAAAAPDGPELPAAATVNPELLAALKQLGYTATEARSFAQQAYQNLGEEAAPELLLREALKVARNA